VLTQGGIQFADGEKKSPSPTAIFLGHPFDRICAEQWVEHRLTQPNHPWTHGRVERINQTIKDATIMRYHCELHGPLLRHLADFVSACDFVQRLETLKCITSTRSSASDGQSGRNYSD
jgi:hypothetical protein